MVASTTKHSIVDAAKEGEGRPFQILSDLRRMVNSARRSSITKFMRRSEIREI